MLRSILIGLDGSACASAAVDLGIRWAQRFDAVLVGLGIVAEPAIRRREPVPIGAGYLKAELDQVILADARRQVDEFLSSFARQCAAAGVEYRLLEDVGSPYAQIIEEARHCDLTLLGQQPHFHFATQDSPDKTLRKVLRRTARPVVAVPESPPEGNGVLVAYNGSPPADRALQAFESLGLGDKDPVYIFSIHPDQAQAQRVAEQAVDFLALHGTNANALPIASTRAADRLITSELHELRPRLLVMGAYGRSMWHELVFGPITTRVLKASPAPVFFCH